MEDRTRTDILLERRRNRFRGIDPYSPMKMNSKVRELNINTKNSIWIDNIFLNENGKQLESVEMVNFDGESGLPHPRYYRKSTFNRIQRKDDGYRTNPFTQKEINPNSVVTYTAKPKSRKGGKRRRKATRKGKQRTRKLH